MSYHYAFRVAPQKELAAVDILNRRGFQAFTPVEQRWRRRSASRHDKSAKTYPMMVGYIFVRFETPYEWPALFNFSMVKSIVGFGGEVARFSDRQIAQLKEISGCTIAHKLSIDTRRKSFAAGDIVRVDRKPVEVKIEEVRGERARVIFALLGSTREQWVPVHRLERAA